jgi:hypothetical protein
VLLAGDAEGREEEYMASGPYTRGLKRSSTFRNYTHSEPRLCALIKDRAQSPAPRVEMTVGVRAPELCLEWARG